MKGLNMCVLMGYAGSDPEVKMAGSESKVAKFSLATSEKYKNRAGEVVQETEWHHIVTWGSTANFVEKYVKKGTPLLAKGKIKHRSYDGKDGVKRYVTEMVMNEIILLPSNTGNKQPEPQHENEGNVQNPPDDDLPF